jgi:hypothetical protein
VAKGDDDGKIWSHLADLARSYGLGGVLVLVGFVIIGLAIFKAPEFTEVRTQYAVLGGAAVLGLLAIVLGLLMLRWKPRLAPRDNKTGRQYDVFIAVPMAGFGTDELGRKAAVDLIRSVESALLKLPGVSSVHAPALVRPEADSYETPATAFDVEQQVLQNTKRYLLILPPTIPPATSVLITAGMAIALDIPSAIFAPEGKSLPYLLDGAVQSKLANIRLHRYTSTKGLEQLIVNDGLRLFGQEPQ